MSHLEAFYLSLGRQDPGGKQKPKRSQQEEPEENSVVQMPRKDPEKERSQQDCPDEVEKLLKKLEKSQNSFSLY